MDRTLTIELRGRGLWDALVHNNETGGWNGPAASAVARAAEDAAREAVGNGLSGEALADAVEAAVRAGCGQLGCTTDNTTEAIAAARLAFSRF